jgi:hypothetical protein
MEINDLEVGKAGEYLVCADLILKGCVAFPSEQGLPYDIVMESSGKLLKVQVKTTRRPKNILQRKNPIPAYTFHIGNNGKGNRRKKYKQADVDLFALVCIESREIAYLPFFDCKTTMNFRVPSERGNYHDEQGAVIKERVKKLRADGMSCADIAEKEGMVLSNVYKYSSVELKPKGTNSGVYFDKYTLERCLNEL